MLTRVAIAGVLLALNALAEQPASPYQGNSLAGGNLSPEGLSDKRTAFVSIDVEAAIAARTEWLKTQTDFANKGMPNFTGMTSFVTNQAFPEDKVQQLNALIRNKDGQWTVLAAQALLLEDLMTGKGAQPHEADFKNLVLASKGLLGETMVDPERLVATWKVWNRLVDKLDIHYFASAPVTYQMMQVVLTVFTR